MYKAEQHQRALPSRAGRLAQPCLSCVCRHFQAVHIAHLVEKVAILAEFSAGAARRPSRAVICGESAFGHILDELLSETYMHRNTEARTHRPQAALKQRSESVQLSWLNSAAHRLSHGAFRDHADPMRMTCTPGQLVAGSAAAHCHATHGSHAAAAAVLASACRHTQHGRSRNRRQNLREHDKSSSARQGTGRNRPKSPLGPRPA